MYTFRWLTDFSAQELLDIFLASFKDYSVPMQITLEQFERKLKMDVVKLDLSIGAFYQDQLIGFVLIGNVRNQLYNSATGVHPEHRGHQLTQKMYQWAENTYKSQFKGIRLEVIRENFPAVRSYQNIGLHIEKEVTCYKGDIQINRVFPKDIQFQQLNFEEIEQFQVQFSSSPTWQNQFHIFEIAPEDFLHIGSIKDEQIIGYISVQKFNNRLVQLFILPEYRNQGYATALLAYISKELGKTLYCINVDDQNFPMVELMKKMQLSAGVQQYEMSITFE